MLAESIQPSACPRQLADTLLDASPQVIDGRADAGRRNSRRADWPILILTIRSERIARPGENGSKDRERVLALVRLLIQDYSNDVGAPGPRRPTQKEKRRAKANDVLSGA